MSARIKGNILTVDGVQTRLSNQELTLLWAVMARPYVTTDSLIEMLWPNPDTQYDDPLDLIRVKLCTLRRKLKLSGWGIDKKYARPLKLIRIG